MDVASFLARAREEGRRYGVDPYVFVRELAQNARDAGARRLDVSVHEDASFCEVCVTDDGTGMSFSHARDFLFRLYASSKEGDPHAAGQFGVGFWSVLAWEPEQVSVQSCCDAQSWGVLLDTAAAAPRLLAGELHHAGTRISLRRRRRPGEPSVHGAVDAALHTYCRYLRTCGRRPRRLAVFLDGRRIDEPLRFASQTSISFVGRRIQGACALGDVPRVELFARGLLVRRATLLDELVPGAPVPTYRQQGAGLAPVLVINSDDLDVAMSRQAARRSRALDRLVRLARRQLDHLVDAVASRACPRSWHERLHDGWDALVRWLGGPARALASFVGLAVVVGASAALAHWVGQRRSPRAPLTLARLIAPAPPRASSLPGPAPLVPTTVVVPRPRGLRDYHTIEDYRGARIDTVDPHAPAWALRYDGPPQLDFKALTLDHFDPRHGWVRGAAPITGPYAAFRCRRHCIRVRLQVDGGADPVILPLPTGFSLDRRSVRVDGRPDAGIATNRYGEALLVLRRPGRHVVRYRAGRFRRLRPVPVVTVPAVPLPSRLQRRVAAERGLPPKLRVERIGRWVRRAFPYDVSPAAAAAFARSRGPWVMRVLAVGVGDCDVKNGLNALLLQHSGIAARLAVGIYAQAGRARAGLHAWTEYYLGGWRQIDVTGRAPATAHRAIPVSGMPAGAVSPGRHRRRATPGHAAPRTALALRRGAGAPSHPRTGQPASRAQERHTLAPRWGGVSAEARRPLTVLHSRRVGSQPASGSQAAEGSSTLQPAIVPRGGDAAGREAVVRRRHKPGLGAGAFVLMLIGLALVALAWRGRAGLGVRHAVLGVGDAAAAQRELAQLLADALRQPAVWRTASSLWHRRLLPTLGGRPLSVAAALQRAARGALWSSQRRSGLARRVVAAGTPVLDASHPVFGTVVAALGSAVDLDRLDPLKPLDLTGPAVEPVIGALLQAANSLLRRSGCTVVCGVSAAAPVNGVAEVDLSGAGLPAAGPWPRRLVALHPAAAVLQRLGQLAAVDPHQALFGCTDWLVQHSELLAEHAERLLQAAAQQLLEAGG